jgi:O-succinylbenzoic acid--CoA ligase
VPALVALDLPGGPAFVDAVRRAWDAGDAVLPVDRRLPEPARRALVAALRPATVIDGDGAHAIDGGQPTLEGDAVVLATSGTTGTPKGVVLTHAAVAASARATSARIGVAAADQWLACLPLAHVGGFSVVARSLVLGTPLTVLPGFEAGAVEAAARGGCTLVSLVATALARVDPALFRVIVLGGARPPEQVPANAVVTYGSTETGSGVVYDGVPLPGVEIRLDADEQVLVRGPMLLRAYRDGTDPKHADGWFPTGDIGSLTADGRLVVHGRRGDLIITGGENVWPDAVEAVLARIEGVADVAVAGIADPEWGQRVVAYVVTAPGTTPTLAGLREHVKATLPAWCAPRELVVVEAIPRTALGKVRRAALTEGR